jgi:hypothetical protein
MRNGARYRADERGRIATRGDDVSCEWDRVQVVLCRDKPPLARAIWGDQDRSDGQQKSAPLDTGHPSTF